MAMTYLSFVCVSEESDYNDFTKGSLSLNEPWPGFKENLGKAKGALWFRTPFFYKVYKFISNLLS